MMNTSRFLSFRRFAPLALGLGLSSLPLPAVAQPIPWVGLGPRGALLLAEQGAGHHAPGPADHFGRVLAAGDFNADGFDDLAAGIPGNDCDFVIWDCGSVSLRFGAAAGPLGGVLTLDPSGVGPSGELPPEPAAAFDGYGRALAVGDFNHDGYDDLVVGIPGNTPQTDSEIDGGVQIHYGLHGSLGSIQWVAEHFLAPGVNGVPEEEIDSVAVIRNDFGGALAVGDFNGDGHDDVAIAAPKAQMNDDSFTIGGNVTVGHGHIGGLVPFDGFLMKLGLQGLPDQPEDNDFFGYSLAAGDFNHDGYDDLAIGVPGEDGVGAVLVVYGSQWSLLFGNHWYFGQWDLNQTTQVGARFGDALAAADFDGDGYDDLAVGAVGYDANATVVDIGLVAVVHGSVTGLGPGRVTWLWEDQLFGAGQSENGDHFGATLAAGDFTGDGRADLSIGIPSENTSVVDAGAVAVVPGTPQGLTGAARRLYPADFPLGLIPDVQTGSPLYGLGLATGDFDGNGFDDLVIGAPDRDDATAGADVGGAAVVFGNMFADDFESGDLRLWSATAP
jgi:hypothetical protein